MPAAITRDELAAAIDAGTVTVVDALPPGPFARRHLPGALNVTAEDADEQVEHMLPDREAAIVAYSADDGCTRGPALAERLAALGYTNVRLYREGIEDWVAAGLPLDRPRLTHLALDDLRTGPTASLFEGFRRAGNDVSMFVVRTPPGRFVPLHVHPYPETFVLLEGRGRWTAGDDVVEMDAEQLLVVPPQTPHGFRNVGDVPLLVVSVHESGTMRQTWLGRDPA